MASAIRNEVSVFPVPQAKAHAPLYAIGVCSDPHATEKRRKSNKDNLFDQTFDNLCDVPLSASTNPERVAQQLMAYYQAPRDFKEDRMCVVFSTYQSIEVVEEAQKRVLEQTQNRFGNFEICFCDEAHRTTQACAKAESTPSFVGANFVPELTLRRNSPIPSTLRLSDCYRQSAQFNSCLIYVMYQLCNESLMHDHRTTPLISRHDRPPFESP